MWVFVLACTRTGRAMQQVFVIGNKAAVAPEYISGEASSDNVSLVGQFDQQFS